MEGQVVVTSGRRGAEAAHVGIVIVSVTVTVIVIVIVIRGNSNSNSLLLFGWGSTRKNERPIPDCGLQMGPQWFGRF